MKNCKKWEVEKEKYFFIQSEIFVFGRAEEAIFKSGLKIWHVQLCVYSLWNMAVIRSINGSVHIYLLTRINFIYELLFLKMVSKHVVYFDINILQIHISPRINK